MTKLLRQGARSRENIVFSAFTRCSSFPWQYLAHRIELVHVGNVRQFGKKGFRS